MALPSALFCLLLTTTIQARYVGKNPDISVLKINDYNDLNNDLKAGITCDDPNKLSYKTSTEQPEEFKRYKIVAADTIDQCAASCYGDPQCQLAAFIPPSFEGGRACHLSATSVECKDLASKESDLQQDKIVYLSCFKCSFEQDLQRSLKWLQNVLASVTLQAPEVPYETVNVPTPPPFPTDDSTSQNCEKSYKVRESKFTDRSTLDFYDIKHDITGVDSCVDICRQDAECNTVGFSFPDRACFLSKTVLNCDNDDFSNDLEMDSSKIYVISCLKCAKSEQKQSQTQQRCSGQPRIKAATKEAKTYNFYSVIPVASVAECVAVCQTDPACNLAGLKPDGGEGHTKMCLLADNKIDCDESAPLLTDAPEPTDDVIISCLECHTGIVSEPSCGEVRVQNAEAGKNYDFYEIKHVENIQACSDACKADARCKSAGYSTDAGDGQEKICLFSEDVMTCNDSSPLLSDSLEATGHHLLTCIRCATEPKTLESQCNNQVRVKNADNDKRHDFYDSKNVANAQECAAACKADSRCQMAGYTSDVGNGPNVCLFSEESVPCDDSLQLLADSPSLSAYMLLTCIKCGKPEDKIEKEDCKAVPRISSAVANGKRLQFYATLDVANVQECGQKCQQDPKCNLAGFEPDSGVENLSSCLLSEAVVECDDTQPILSSSSQPTESSLITCMKCNKPADVATTSTCNSAVRVQNANRSNRHHWYNTLHVDNAMACADACKADTRCKLAGYMTDGDSGEGKICLLSEENEPCVESSQLLADSPEPTGQLLLTCIKCATISTCNNAVRVQNADRSKRHHWYNTLHVDNAKACADACKADTRCKLAGYMTDGDSGEGKICLLSEENEPCVESSQLLADSPEPTGQLLLTCIKCDADIPSLTTEPPKAGCNIRVARAKHHDVTFYKDETVDNPRQCAELCQKDPQCVTAGYSPSEQPGEPNLCLFSADSYTCDNALPSLNETVNIDFEAILTCLQCPESVTTTEAPKPQETTVPRRYCDNVHFRVEPATVAAKAINFYDNQVVENEQQCADLCFKDGRCQLAGYFVGIPNTGDDAKRCLLSSDNRPCNEQAPMFEQLSGVKYDALFTCLRCVYDIDQGNAMP